LRRGFGCPSARKGGLCLSMVLGFLGLAAMNLACGSPVPARPASTPPVATAPVRAPWLGLNYNSSSETGHLRDFAARRIVYDRDGKLETGDGHTPQNSPRLASGLRTAALAGMVPDVDVNPSGGPSGCSGDPNGSTRCLPTSQADIQSYVQGFVHTATAILDAYPGKTVLFEPMNEPWNWGSPPGTSSGRMAASEYAAILAQLLPRATAAKIPLSDIYVPATGMLSDGTSWVPDLYAAQPCLKPGPGSCGPILGWNMHPYGLPYSLSEGIGLLPVVRAGMLSGQNNIVVSEIGFCAQDVSGGRGCSANRSDIDGLSTQAAAWLAKTLDQALVMHRAGWLKALLIWDRAGDGWAMQNRDGSLTAQGRVLDLFAGGRRGSPYRSP